ncbi:hypothetical protein K503DRAFT_700176 [Rhizopogon vinicolor AM-OR11-026]|uniref:Uncharacterized protein n=1 Tax=Rhizopogon vinicolor AM-OR11-026 TaxID=1314800 RepID=A0A1B7MLW4_9AGAM|nr:hypothetical protein K503DRAFT_700176 [Rhizopogon vinicolor AM-OR11-026]
MDAREDLPKISVETEQDWRRLQRNISTAFLGRLDMELQAQGASHDMDTFLPHMNQFLDTLFAITRPNLRINGRTTEEPPEDDEEMEPFDEALDRHIWSLSDQRLKWDREIAGRRRTRPMEIEALVQEIYGQHRDVDLDDATQNSGPSDVYGFFPLPNSVFMRFLQSISMVYERADRFAAVASEVKALKP